MNLRKLDLDMLRDMREISIKRIQQVDAEIDRRMDLQQGKVAIEQVPVSQLATKEGVTPNTIVERCKRKDIPVTDKEGNPSRRGHTAYVNVNLYNLHY